MLRSLQVSSSARSRLSNIPLRLDRRSRSLARCSSLAAAASTAIWASDFSAGVASALLLALDWLAAARAASLLLRAGAGRGDGSFDAFDRVASAASLLRLGVSEAATAVLDGGAASVVFDRAARAAILSRFGGDVDGSFDRAAKAAILSRFGGDVVAGDPSLLPVVTGDLPDRAASAAILSRLGGEAVLVELPPCCCCREARAAILSRLGAGEAAEVGGCSCGCCWGAAPAPEPFPPLLLSASFREAIAANLSRDMMIYYTCLF